jgi:hypothetical protein
LGGSDPISEADTADIKSCLLFHVNRESLTPQGENALRAKGIVVVPHILLCSIEVLAADSLSDPDISSRVENSNPDELAALGAELRSVWRHRLLAAWERVLARTKEEQCSAHAAAVRIAAEGLIQTSRTRFAAAATLPPEDEAPPAAEQSA